MEDYKRERAIRKFIRKQKHKKRSCVMDDKTKAEIENAVMSLHSWIRDNCEPIMCYINDVDEKVIMQLKFDEKYYDRMFVDHMKRLWGEDYKKIIRNR